MSPTVIDMSHQPAAVHYLPIATTILSAIFCVVLLRRYTIRRTGPHLLWWAAGIFFYGLGTGLESAITLLGNSIALNKAWYIAGALLGGYPLAQGSVYLLLSRKIAHGLTAATLPFIVFAAIMVVLSPVSPDVMEPHRPSGAILQWQWVRLLTPVINLYAVIFLIGGAILSAVRWARRAGGGRRAVGNGLIAFGAILPGIGGGMAKAGIVEGLYVGEFVGLLFIWAGFFLCTRSAPPIAMLSSPDTLESSSGEATRRSNGRQPETASAVSSRAVLSTLRSIRQ